MAKIITQLSYIYRSYSYSSSLSLSHTDAHIVSYQGRVEANYPVFSQVSSYQGHYEWDSHRWDCNGRWGSVLSLSFSVLSPFLCLSSSYLHHLSSSPLCKVNRRSGRTELLLKSVWRLKSVTLMRAFWEFWKCNQFSFIELKEGERESLKQWKFCYNLYPSLTP